MKRPAGVAMPLLVSLLAAAAPAAFASAQDVPLPPVSYPSLPVRAADAEGFAPRGWRVETMARGDLNGDGIADLAFTLRTRQPVDSVTDLGMAAGQAFDSSPHILAVAFARPDGGYRLALRNHVLIPRPADPTEAGWMFEDGSLRISRGVLLVILAHLQSSAGARTFHFRWQGGAFRLIGYDFTDVHRYSHCRNMVSIDYLARRMRTAHADSEEAPDRIRWRRLPVRPLWTIDRLGDGMRFDPERAVGAISCRP